MAREERVKRILKDKICEICGSTGKSEKLVTCYRCKKATEHTYCMRNELSEVPQLWYCEECLSSAHMVDREKVNTCKSWKIADGSSRLGITENSIRRSLILDGTQSPGHRAAEKHSGGVGSSLNQHMMKPFSQCIPSRVLKEQKSKFLPLEEIVKWKSEVRSRRHGSLGVSFHRNGEEKIMRRSTSGGPASPASAAFKVLSLPNRVPIDADAHRFSEKFMTTSNDKDSPIERMKSSGTAFYSKSEFKRTDFQEMDIPVVLVPTRYVCWMGRFDVHDLVSHDYSGIQAVFSTQMSLKVYDISKHLPEILNFKVLERSKVWPRMFRLDPPIESDIGLFFFSSKADRHKEKYIRLVERLDSRDQALQGLVNDVELLVFVSTQLPADSQRKDGNHYLWAVFRHLKPKKFFQKQKVKSPSNNSAAPVSNNNCAQLNISSQRNHRGIDMLWDEEIDRTDKSTPSFVTPLGFPEPRNPNCEKHSSVKFPLEKVAKPIDPVSPPGFSKPNPPSNSCVAAISSYSCAQLRVPSRRNHREREMVCDKDIDRTQKSVPSFDTLPGFPARRNPNHEKSSAVRSPLEKVADTIYPEVPPGFSKLNPPISCSAAMGCNIVSQSNVLPPKNHKEVGMVCDNGIDRTNKWTPNFDTQPGFPKARDQNCRKHSVTFPLEKVAAPIAPNIPPPPGFPEIQSSKHQSNSHKSSAPNIPPPGFPEIQSSKHQSNSHKTSCDDTESSRLDGSCHVTSRAVNGYALTDSKPREMHLNCHQVSDNWPKSGQHPRNSHPVHLMEEDNKFKSFSSPNNNTKLCFRGKNILSSSATEKVCSSFMKYSAVHPNKTSEGTEKMGNQGEKNSDITSISSHYNGPSAINSEETDMDIDMVGGKEIGRIDIPMPRVDTWPSLPKPIQEIQIARRDPRSCFL